MLLRLGQLAPGRTALTQAAEGFAVAGGACLAGRVGVFFQAAVVPVGEPHLLGGVVHVLLVEDAGVGHEAVEGVTVDAGQVVDAVAAVRGSHGRYAAHVRLGLDVAGGGEVVLHVEAGVVSGNLLAPLLAEGRGAAAVGKYHDIALVAHLQEVPAVAPALGQGVLRAAFAHLDGRIGLGRVELGRVQHPGEHLLAVHGGEPAGFRLMAVQLGQDVLVLEGNLAEAVAAQGHQLGGEVHGAVGAQERSVLQYAEGAVDVEPEGVGCQAFGLAAGNHVIEGADSFRAGGKVQGLAVIGPAGGVNRVFEIRGEFAHVLDGRVASLAFLAVVIDHVGHHDAVFVGLVAVTGHREPAQLPAVGAPGGFGVVAAGEGELRGFPGEGAVDEDAGVGGEGVLLAFQLLAGVGDEAAVGAPGKVRDVREGAVGQLELHFFASQDVHSGGNYAVTQGGHIGMRDFRQPMVPVAVHEVFRGIRLCLVQHRVRVGGYFHGAVDIGNIHELAAVGGEGELFHAAGDIGLQDALAQFSVRIGGLEELAALQEEDGFSVGAPAGAGDAFPVHREQGGVTAFHGNGEKVAYAAVGGDVRVAHAVQDGFLVGGELGVAQAAQRQEHFGGHAAIGHLDGGRADVSFLRFHLTVLTGCDGHYGCRQR